MVILVFFKTSENIPPSLRLIITSSLIAIPRTFDKKLSGFRISIYFHFITPIF